MIMTRERSFYKSFFALFWPLVLQNVVNLAVNLVDNIMLGSYSQPALSGASAVNMIQFILQSVLGGIGSGLAVLGSQYWGQKRTEPIKKLSTVALTVSVAIAVIIFAVCLILPRGVVSLFINDEAAISEGIKYLRVINYSYLLFAVYTALLYALNCVETVKLAFWISVQTLIVNVGLNAFLIPAYGSVGAAWATVAARAVSLVIVLYYVRFIDKKLNFRLKDYFIFDKQLSLDYIKVTAPLVAVAAMWGFSNSIQTAILGHLPNSQSVVAANSASSTLYNLFKAGAQGAAASTSILIAKTVGKGDINKVKEYSRTLQVMFVILGFITAGLLLLAKNPVLSLYSLSDDTIKMANQFILVMSICALGMSYQMPTITGIIRGGGDTRFCMYNDIISIWCIVLPVSWLAAYVFKWPPVAVVACLNADQVFKCGAGFIRCNGYKWVRKLTREENE